MSNRRPSAAVDFVGIGAPRAGTTYLDALLRTHEGLHLPLDRKEVHFFDQNLDRGEDWYRDIVRRKSEAHQKCGEVTPAYLFNTEAPRKLASIAPDAKLIVCLRDPIKRAFSHHQRVTEILGEKQRFLNLMGSDSPVFTASLYAANMERWLEHFPIEQLLALTPESLDKVEMLSVLASHLGVEQGGFKPPEGPINVASKNKSKLYLAAKSIGRFAHRHDIASVLKLRMAVSRQFGGQRQQAAVREMLDDETYRLASKWFQADAIRLKTLIGFDAEAAWPELFQ